MVTVIITEPFPRILYTLEVIFGVILKVPYRWVTLSEANSNESGAWINYTSQDISRAISIPNSGFLSSTSIEKTSPTIHHGSIPYLFSHPEGQPGGHQRMKYDLFAAAFFLLTFYEMQAGPVFDDHGRYLETQYESFSSKWYKQPLVNLYAEELWALLATKLPEGSRKIPSFKPEITFDIDQPWRFLKKSFSVTIGGIGKRLVKGELASLTKQLIALLSGKDPNDTFSEIFQVCRPESTRFFFLVDRNSPHDTRFTYRHTAMQSLIREIQKRGYGTGIHPSYHSFLDGDMIVHETESLSKVLDAPVIHSRQHFLKYRLPETFRSLIAAGIRHEYSASMVNEIGFRAGIAHPYPWFDLEKNEMTSLILHPTFLMDRTFKDYLKLSPEASLAKASELIETLKSVHAEGAFLFHNDALSDSGEWKGWKDSLIKILHCLSADTD